MIPADSILLGANKIMCNESALTGESLDLHKSASKDCFLLSSTLVTEGEEVLALVTGIGINSQWGKIKLNLVSESVNTPLQDKLEDMAKMVFFKYINITINIYHINLIC
jgi:magnesium-transporting ATPase (P-type)